MRITQIVSGAAVVIAAFACSHNRQEPAASGDTRIKPSSQNPARDSSSEYGNQGTRMGSPSDSSRSDQRPGATSAAGSESATAAQNDPNLIGSPAWWRTHLTADGKPRP